MNKSELISAMAAEAQMSKAGLKSKENQGFPAVWGDFFVVLGVKDE